MTSPRPPISSPPPDDRETGLPFFRTWRSVYILVLACFAAVLVALALFSQIYA
jgi:hypothetical protein